MMNVNLQLIFGSFIHLTDTSKGLWEKPHAWLGTITHWCAPFLAFRLTYFLKEGQVMSVRGYFGHSGNDPPLLECPTQPPT